MDERSKFEARRKKILENAEARLMKITGRAHHVSTTPDVPNGEPSLNCEARIPAERCAKQNCRGHNSSVNEENSSSSVNHINPYSRVEDASQVGKQNTTEKMQENVLLIKCSHGFWTDYIIFVFLALTVCLCFNLGLSWIFGESVVIPFIVCCLPRTLFQSGDFQKEEPVMFFTLLTLSGLPQWKINFAKRIFFFFRHLFVLFSLYIFTFVISHCILECSFPS